MFYIAYYQTLIKNAPFSPNQPPTPTTRFKQHVSNSTFQTPLLHPEKSSIIPLPTATIWHLVLSHYTLTAGHPPSLGAQPLHLYRRSSSFNWCSEPVKEFIATKAFSYVPKYLMKQS